MNKTQREAEATAAINLIKQIQTLNSILPQTPPKVLPMTTPGGNPSRTQFIIITQQGTYFQSYSSTIAFIPNNSSPTQLDRSTWNYSRTTNKYRNIFLEEGIATTKEKIANGTYILKDLNK